MKKIIVSLFLMNVFAAAYCQQYKVQVVSSSADETVLKVLVNSFDWEKKKGSNGKVVSVKLKDAATFQMNEFIELPELNFCLLQNDNATPNISCEIINSVNFDAFDITNASDMTAQKEGKSLPAHYAKLKNSFSDGNQTGMVLSLFPVQYLPELNKLKLCTEMIVKVSHTTQKSAPLHVEKS